MIGEKEKYALIGDSLDWAFMDLVVGLEPFYSARNPKPPTPTPPPMPTPPPEPEVPEGAAEVEPSAEGDALGGEAVVDGTKTEGAIEVKAEEVEAPAPKEPTPPPPPPPPFEYAIDLPPEGAEVPYVKNYDGPPIEAISSDGQQTVEGVPADGQPPATVEGVTEGAAPVESETVAPIDAASQAENAPVQESPAA